MFDTIILVTGAIEQTAMLQVLFEHNPALTIISIMAASEFSDLDPGILQHARLIAFATSVIVPPFVLARLGYGAYNFHPGPPEYPGWAPSHFALYAGDVRFGATAHAMVEEVDSGPIVAVERFEVPPERTVAALEGRAYAHLALMFWKLAKPLATRPEPLPELPVRWGKRKSSRRSFARMCEIPIDISEEDLHRRIAIFGTNRLGVAPTINLYGIEFRAVR
jgi:methionyl-tRNA formyltransferase